MRSVIILVLLAAGLGTGAWFWNRSRGTAPGTSGSDSSKSAANTAVVERGSVEFTVGVAGEIGPAEQVSVRPEVNGKISELPVDVGDRVPKGGLLFALDDRDLRLEVESREQQIESSRLQLDKARIAMEQAKRDFARDSELFEAKLLAAQAFEASREHYDSSAKDHDLARNQIDRSIKDVDLAKERLLKTRIIAPFDCTILTRPVSAGQAVSGSGGFNSGTEVLTIADLSSMVINAHVNQADVTRLRTGMDVDIEVDAIPGLRARGKVERMAPQATVKTSIKGYATRIALSEVDPRIQPGMTASITIPVSAAADVLTIPLTAVFSDPNHEHYVYVKSGDSFEYRTVVVGISDAFKAEIKSGVTEGDIVSFEQPSGAASRVPGSGPAGAQAGTARPASPTTATNAAPPASRTASTRGTTSSGVVPLTGGSGSIPTASNTSGTVTQRTAIVRPGA